MALDAVKNFARVGVSTGYDTAATAVTLDTGDGAKLPNTSIDGLFNLVWYNSTDYINPTDDPNKEIVRVTARTGDVLTSLLRAQEGTLASAKNITGKKYRMFLPITKKSWDDINNHIINITNPHSSRISNLVDTNIATPANQQILRYNSTNSKWENTADVISFNGRVGAVVPLEGDYSLTTLNDVTITTPASGQVLRHNGANWVNAQLAHSDLNLDQTHVNSFNTRTGAVVPVLNDYTWTQINKAISSLADITTKSHTVLSDIGTNTHVQIDTHIVSAINPHGTTLTQTNLNLTGTFDISNTAPAITLTDTTTSAKSLKIDVDGNVAQIREKASASGSLISLDLINNRVGIGTITPSRTLHIKGIPYTYARFDAGAPYPDWIIGADLFGFIFYNDTNGSYIMVINGNGNVGIGLISPTAVLHLKAGTASANTAPIKLSAGTNLTTPEAGAVEWDGTNLFITQSTGVRKQIAFV